MSFNLLKGSDRTIRIWNNQKRREIARLSHNAAVVSVAWMDGDAGIVSLADDGMVSKWTRTVSLYISHHSVSSLISWCIGPESLAMGQDS